MFYRFTPSQTGTSIIGIGLVAGDMEHAFSTAFSCSEGQKLVRSTSIRWLSKSPNNLDTVIHQAVAESAQHLPNNPLLANLESSPKLFEDTAFGGDDMHKRAALGSWGNFCLVESYISAASLLEDSAPPLGPQCSWVCGGETSCLHKDRARKMKPLYKPGHRYGPYPPSGRLPPHQSSLPSESLEITCILA